MSTVHPIFQAVLAGQYERGLDLYAALASPDPVDDRWAGYCLFLAGRLLDAKELLLRSRSRGCAQAGLELLSVLRGLGDVESATLVLAALPTASFSPTERAYAHREEAVLHLAAGQLPAARASLELAWSLLGTQDAPSSGLRLQTAQLLGLIYHRLGRSTPASHYLNLALDEPRGGAVGAKRLRPLLTRAEVYLYDGQYDLSQADLDEAGTLLWSGPGASASHAYLLGLLARAQGRWTEARHQFQTAAEQASAGADTSIELMAFLGQSSIATVEGRLQDAGHHVRRASRLVQTPWEQAMCDLREGYWLARSGRPNAEAVLQRAGQAFRTMNLPRETAWAELHLAGLHADRSEAAALAAVHRAAEQRAELNSGASLLPELRLLPDLTALLGRSGDDPEVALLMADRRAALGDAPLHLRLVTLGATRLEADGTEVRLGMRRTTEVLAYLLLYGQVTRDELLAALWPDEDPTRARNYFHQVVHALKDAVPSLRIEYLRATRRYTLTCEGPLLEWDATRIKSALSSQDENERQRAVLEYSGPFLPDAETDWAREERDALTFSVIGVGLKLMAQWSASGDYQKCAALARRLLDVDPCDESLAEYFVLATFELEGRIAAQRALLEVAGRAERELNTSPDWLSRLAVQLQPSLN